MSNTDVKLNPRYIKSGFRNQANNIKRSCGLSQRKVACLLECVANHLLEHGAKCYASTSFLLKRYNESATRYGVSSITERSLFNLLKKTEELKLIERTSSKFCAKTGTRKRFITICIDTLQSSFSGVFNYAADAAQKFITRMSERAKFVTPPNRGKNENSQSQNKASAKPENAQKMPSDSWFVERFKKDADAVISLQKAARSGVITPGGAKLYIELYKRHRQYIAPKFLSYLNAVIHNPNMAEERAKQAAKQAELRKLEEAELKREAELRRGVRGRSSDASSLKNLFSTVFKF